MVEIQGDKYNAASNSTMVQALDPPALSLSQVCPSLLTSQSVNDVWGVGQETWLGSPPNMNTTVAGIQF